MKKTLVLIALLSLPLALKAGPDRRPPPVALTLIVDTSPSMKEVWREATAISRQAVSSLKPDDTLDVISAHHRHARLELAQSIRTGSLEEVQTINMILGHIDCASVLGADVGEALTLAVQRRRDPPGQAGNGSWIVILLTDGRIKDEQVERILTLAEKVRDRKGRLYLTGTDRTNKRILLAAAGQHAFTWSPIPQARPDQWLAEVRRIAAEGPVLTPAAAIRPAPLSAPDAGAWSPGVLSLSPDRDWEGILLPFLWWGPVGPANAEGAPLHRTVNTSPPSVPSKTVASPPPSCRKNPPAVICKSLVPPAPGSAHVLPRNPHLPTVTPEVRRPTPPVSPPPPSVGPGVLAEAWARIRTIPWPVWAILPMGLAAAIVATSAIRSARQWRIRVQSHLNRPQSATPTVLMMKVNDRTLHQLGAPETFPAIHTGSGPDNAIRIADKDVQARHLRIYRKGGQLWCRNLAATPILVNHGPVKPGGKHRLVVPSLIQLSDHVKLNLYQVTSNPNPQEERKTEHGNDYPVQEKLAL